MDTTFTGHGKCTFFLLKLIGSGQRRLQKKASPLFFPGLSLPPISFASAIFDDLDRFSFVPLVFLVSLVLIIFPFVSQCAETGFVAIMTGIIYVFDPQAVNSPLSMCRYFAVIQER